MVDGGSVCYVETKKMPRFPARESGAKARGCLNPLLARQCPNPGVKKRGGRLAPPLGVTAQSGVFAHPRPGSRNPGPNTRRYGAYRCGPARQLPAPSRPRWWRPSRAAQRLREAPIWGASHKKTRVYTLSACPPPFRAPLWGRCLRLQIMHAPCPSRDRFSAGALPHNVTWPGCR